MFGTSIQYAMEHPEYNVKSVFVTTTVLSETALKFAKHLNIEVVQKKCLKNFQE